MLISNKLHSFRNFSLQIYKKILAPSFLIPFFFPPTHKKN